MLELDGTIWLRAGEDNWGGRGRIELLAAIGQTGSITAGAKAVGLSYKAAWDAIDTMNNLAGEPLVVRTTGGKGGGGSVLTPRAQRLIESFRALEAEHRRFVERLDAAAQAASEDVNLLRRLMLRTSARNTLFGTVESVAPGAVNDVVTLRLPGGQAVAATITQESTRVLGLAPGVQAVALIKAPAVMLMRGAGEWRVSAENQLPCVVTEIRDGAVQAEVRLRLLDANAALAGETVLVAMLSRTAVETLALAEGVKAVAVFEASSVILGLA
ncbi:TOBE domain-containing protein [Ralstonia sp. NFACC01]|jgi:molybdate transport system regulatory protein|uniref:TOBE domain-containing protein n=1 Tax=Ralstonia sp. NFACC01 TaxID=1566294 RepID=UPI0008E5E36B|nr:TOBE domain-containing protein [Ralstonia sp. NFACC01]SFP53066.1 molybdate transport system regulatory protein [Ralstonia sp. NFACC01]